MILLVRYHAEPLGGFGLARSRTCKSTEDNHGNFDASTYSLSISPNFVDDECLVQQKRPSIAGASSSSFTAKKDEIYWLQQSLRQNLFLFNLYHFSLFTCS